MHPGLLFLNTKLHCLNGSSVVIVVTAYQSQTM